jgi:hypothetical protein
MLLLRLIPPTHKDDNKHARCNSDGAQEQHELAVGELLPGRRSLSLLLAKVRLRSLELSTSSGALGDSPSFRRDRDWERRVVVHWRDMISVQTLMLVLLLMLPLLLYCDGSISWSNPSNEEKGRNGDRDHFVRPPNLEIASKFVSRNWRDLE